MFPDFEKEEVGVLLLGVAGAIPWTYRFNWENKQLVTGLDGRFLKTLTYAEYLEEVAKKILNTKRFQYSIYSERMGVDFLDDIGKLRNQLSLPAIKVQVEEALEAHSEIEQAEVTDIHFEHEQVVFTVAIEGVRGKTRVEVNVWQR
ncbi:DUF2634 domain-containing protein [Brevibacillus sp. SYSU BS000544]|uniref:DUF2634 domain-containing protein n=1 Tax=Brevibacillus sp. SYSU BS000544 TaxID=3416443 RepID=UPI003CE4A32C